MTAEAQTQEHEPLKELWSGADIAPDLDPLADGILMKHQREWLEDQNPLKIAEKGRRTGITFAEALDDTLIAAAKRSAGGDNVFYIGDTKDKGREFISYVAHFAQTVAGELGEIEEYVFKDQREDGSSKDISAYRVKFRSGNRVEALSSNPANIRGLQGIVVIDEAAFHSNVREVIDAVNALLIWEGRVRVISTHNGHLNPFNELIREAQAGKNGFRVHHIPFSKAVENGLYKRVCYVKGREWTQEAQDDWEALIRNSYGARTSAMRQELDAVPAEAEGSALTRVLIEGCMSPLLPYKRWVCADEFRNYDKRRRHREAEEWCETELRAILDKLDENLLYFAGEDFARSGDATDIVILEQRPNLTFAWALTVELRNVPFDQQWQIFKYVLDRVPRLCKGAVDKGGNGAYLAEKAVQRYGEVIEEVSFSREWYAREMPPYIDAFSDQSILLPKHADILADHQALQWVDGIIRVPSDFRFKGSDGLDRHGDSAVAGPLAYYASRQDYVEYGYRGVKADRGPQEEGRMRDRPSHDDDGPRRDPFRSPLGARLRGGVW